VFITVYTIEEQLDMILITVNAEEILWEQGNYIERYPAQNILLTHTIGNICQK
jgi:hypothetical protein